MNGFKKKFLRKTRAKLRKVKQEYEETEAIFQSACFDFSQEIVKYCKENKLNPPFKENENKEKENDKELFRDSEIKDLYKKIAISTHPDKLICSSEVDKEDKVSLFRKATKAKTSSDLGSLAEVAVELNINLSDLKFEQLELLEKQINKKEAETDKMRRSLAWVWYYSNKENRLNLIKSVFNYNDRGEKR